MDAGVIAGWMLLNYVLSQNGLRVVNGFTDILTPFLTSAGGSACATGWWSNLRLFSMGRYVRQAGGGGRPPKIRYLSKSLMSRITRDERENYAQFSPDIVNKLRYDREYDEGTPDRTEEALQMWEALRSLNQEIVTGALENDLAALRDRVTRASEAYVWLRSNGLTEDYEATAEYLDQLSDAIEAFKRLAEL